MAPGSPRLALLGALLLVVLAAGTAHADHPAPEGGVDHLSLVVQDIEPGAEHALEVLSSTHGGLRPGWIYILYGYAQGNHSLDIVFRHEGEVLENWTWPANVFTTNITKIRHEGAHEVVIRNHGPETVRYAFYYDQSCNCAQKLIRLPGGVSLFNNPYPADRRVSIAFPLADDWRLYGALATHNESSPTAAWPDDFQILQETEAQGPGAGVRGSGWLNFTFETQESRMYYVYLKALNGGDPEDPILLTPIYDVAALDASNESPGPTTLLAVAALAVVCAIAAATRKRRA